MKLFSAEIRPLLSLFQSAGPLLHHKQLGLMSFDLTLMTDSASVPAGKRADGNATESHANSYLQQLREQFSFLSEFPLGCFRLPCGDRQRNDAVLGERGGRG